MLNQVVLVGRLVRDPELKDFNNGKYSKVTVAVPRSYKDINGQYETDFIDCTLWKGVAENTCQYCKKGDIVGVRGRMQTNNYTVGDEKKQKIEVIAEKVTFLSPKKSEEENQEDQEN